MNLRSRQFFEEKPFKEVRLISEEPNVSWAELSQLAFNLPRGWFELSRVKASDRVEFIRDFWLDRLPYHPRAHPGIFEFFEQLDDVAVILTRQIEAEPFDAELVYSLADNSSFFRGKPPYTDLDLQRMPRDYQAFTRIHNGFGKLSEMGLLEVEDLPSAQRRVMDLVLQTGKQIQSGHIDVDPSTLIPFYEALGLSSFQCFYTDWYPGNEMGNVYVSGIDYTLSDLSDKKMWTENLAFPTFSEWLVYYLQGCLCT